MSNRPKSAHKYNVQEQQDIYREEIARIWKQQWDSLTNPQEPLLSQEDEDRARGRVLEAKKKAGAISTVAQTPASLAGTPAARAGSPGSRAGSVDIDDGASVATARNGEKAKTLRIKRLVRLSSFVRLSFEADPFPPLQINGKWETEIVRDPSVIKAYVHQRSVIDEEKLEADELLPSDDEGKNERRKKRCVSFPSSLASSHSWS
jgi:hypothetical protein